VTGLNASRKHSPSGARRHAPVRWRSSFAKLPKRLTVGDTAGEQPNARRPPTGNHRHGPVKAHPSQDITCKVRCLPEKPHLRWAMVPVFAHVGLWAGYIGGVNRGAQRSRKTSPARWCSRIRGPRRAWRGGPTDPVKAHVLASPSSVRLPNPLTTYPAAAHGHSRTPSRNAPATSHDCPCKSSRCTAQTREQQGFAKSLTFLNKVQGCLLLWLSRKTVVCHWKIVGTILPSVRHTSSWNMASIDAACIHPFTIKDLIQLLRFVSRICLNGPAVQALGSTMQRVGRQKTTVLCPIVLPAT